MNQTYVQPIIDAQIGSRVYIGDNECSVVGKFKGSYFPDGPGIGAVAYVLSLEGRQELGAELRNGEWNVWYSRYSGTCNPGEIENRISRLNDVEVGMISREWAIGETSQDAFSYAFGKKLGKGVFLAEGVGNTEIWVTSDVDDFKVL